MNFVRLLAAGRSIFGLGPAPARYKMTEQNLLPKFEPTKEPGWSRTATSSSATAPTPAPSKRRPLFQNPFTSRNTIKGSRPLVQPELALGAVKVVRNDLNEADVELIPARLETRKSQKVEEAPVGSGRNRGWSELSARLFEAGRLRS